MWFDLANTVILRMDDAGGSQNVYLKDWYYSKLSEDDWRRVASHLRSHEARLSVCYSAGWVDDGDPSRGELEVEGETPERVAGRIYPSPLVRYRDTGGHRPGTTHDYQSEFRGIQLFRSEGAGEVELHGYTHINPDTARWAAAPDRYESAGWYHDLGGQAAARLAGLTLVEHPLYLAAQAVERFFGIRPTTLTCPQHICSDESMAVALRLGIRVVSNDKLALRIENEWRWVPEIARAPLSSPDPALFDSGYPVIGYFHDRDLAIEGVDWLGRKLDEWVAAGARRFIDFREFANIIEHRVDSKRGDSLAAADRARVRTEQTEDLREGSRRGRIVAKKNPVVADNSGLAIASLRWESEGTETVEVRIETPDGTLFSRTGPSGAGDTGKWVYDGMTFYLQDVSNGLPLTADNTLATVTVSVVERDESERSGRNQGAGLWERMRNVARSLNTRSINMGELRRLSPVSSRWGVDRGVPVDRYYIEAFLKRNAADIRGRVLEVANNYYTRRFGGARVTQSDIIHGAPGNSDATIVGDLAVGTNIPAETFDCVILTQTLPLIYDVGAAVRTLHRILKPGGVLLGTFPGIAHKIMRYPDFEDYWRFTSMSARRLFEPVFGKDRVAVEARGNVLVAISFLHGLAAEELTREELEYNDPEFEVSVAVRALKFSG